MSRSINGQLALPDGHSVPRRRPVNQGDETRVGRTFPGEREGRRPRLGTTASHRIRTVRTIRTDQMNELISIVSSRPGPTPIAEIWAPDMSSSALTYAWAFFGRSEKDFALVMSSDQPGRFS